MWIAVVPAHNEEHSISQVMENLSKVKMHQIILVTNGCIDRTREIAISSAGNTTLCIVDFVQPLGIDIPRAIGAVFAKALKPCGLIFVDGDMKGDITYALHDLKNHVEKGCDMALTNCYPFIYQRSKLAHTQLKERELLNRRLGVFNRLGLSTPSHGPHAISAKLLQALPRETIAIPPLSLVFALKNNFSVSVATSISHNLLGSQIRNSEHAELITETIVGDCRQALLYAETGSLEEALKSTNDHVGYRLKRRFDLLSNFLKKNEANY